MVHSIPACLFGPENIGDGDLDVLAGEKKEKKEDSDCTDSVKPHPYSGKALYSHGRDAVLTSIKYTGS